MLHPQLVGDFQRDRRALEILFVRSQEHHQDIRDANREQGLLVQARVGIKQEVVEREQLAQRVKTVLQEVDLVALTQDLGNVPGVDAGGQQVERSTRASLLASADW